MPDPIVHPELSIREITAKVDGLKELMDERDRRYEDRFTAMDEKTSLALTASEKAVVKAETATEKRFDSVNEFRKTLSDQATSFMPRGESSAQLESIHKEIEEAKTKINELEKSRSGANSADLIQQRDSARLMVYIGIIVSIILSLISYFKK